LVRFSFLFLFHLLTASFFFIHIPSCLHLCHTLPLSCHPLAMHLPFATRCPSSHLCHIPPSLCAAPSPHAAFALAMLPLVMCRLCCIMPSSHIALRMSHCHVAMLGSGLQCCAVHACFCHAPRGLRSGRVGSFDQIWSNCNCNQLLKREKPSNCNCNCLQLVVKSSNFSATRLQPLTTGCDRLPGALPLSDRTDVSD
jgi:hypothetical protein